MSDVNVSISADSAGVSAGLAKAQEAVNSFRDSATDSVRDIGSELTKGFAAGAIIEGIKSLGDEFDRVEKLSKRFGETTDTIQRVGSAANESGTDLETVAKAMTHVTDNGVQASQGNAKMADAFKVLNISSKDFVDLPLEDKLLKLSEGYQDGKSDAEKMNAVMTLLGRSGADLIPMLQQGSDALSGQFSNAAVASAANVKALSEATVTLGHDFEQLKAWGADALGFLIRGTQSLGTGMAVIVAYLGNLHNGFKAAKDAANDALQAAADLQLQEEKKDADDLASARNNPTSDDDAAKDAEDAKQRAQEQKENDKRAAEELARLQEENAKKVEDAHIRSITLAQRQVEIAKELADLQKTYAQDKGLGAEQNALLAANKALDLQKEQEENAKKIAEEKDKSDREAKERAKEIAEIGINAEKQKLEAAQDKLDSLKAEHTHGIKVDDLRSIGGGYAGVNYAATNKDALVHQQIALQKETVKELQKAVKALEAKEKFNESGGNGAFNLS